MHGRELRREARLAIEPDYAGFERAAVMKTLIMTVKRNDIDPQAWLANMLARIASFPQGRLHEMVPRNWSAHVRPVASPQAA